MARLKYNEFVVVNGQELNKKYIQTLSYEEREALIEPIFKILRGSGFVYPDDESKLNASYKRILNYESVVENDSIFNNISIGTDICKHFCNEFFITNEKNKPNMVELYDDDDVLRRVIKNRLGMDWLLDDERGKGVNQAFNFRFKMVIQGMRSMRLVNATSMFKPTIARYICERYSEKGDLVGDYSAGFGGRLLGAMAAERRYIGTDPLTTSSLQSMIDFYKFKDAEVINSGSEDYCGDENSYDLYWSSPPYYDQEFYSDADTQAYSKGEEHFYDVYWKGTLKNVRYMLKPGKWFGLNVTNYPKMLEMAEEVFGDVEEKVGLRTVRSHLAKSAGVSKEEYVYMFKNNK